VAANAAEIKVAASVTLGCSGQTVACGGGHSGQRLPCRPPRKGSTNAVRQSSLEARRDNPIIERNGDSVFC
jgi:hypothetical protein